MACLKETLGVELRPYQEKAFRSVLSALGGGRKSALLVMATGCHAPHQKILMFNGSLKRADEVEVGDFLMGPDSTPREVLVLHRGRDEMFRVTPVKGEPFDVNGGHVLSLVRTNQGRGRDGGAVVDVTVREWMSWGRTQKHIHKLFRAAVDFPYRDDQEVDPYVVGMFLGDGSTREGGGLGVTTADPEIESECLALAAAYGLGTRPEPAGGRSRTIYFSGTRGPGGNALKDALRRAGVVGMSCGDKRIPFAYRTGPRGVRLQVLAGLMDTDGHLTSGGYDFISKSRGLAEDVAFVARSLGLAAYVTTCAKSCQTAFRRIYYRVSVSGNVAMIPCRLPRKVALERRQIKSALRTGFSVRSVGEGEYFGWTVDGDNRYLMGDFTVTHNCGKTVVFGAVAHHFVHELGGRVLVLAHRGELLEQAQAKLDYVGVDSVIEKAEQRAWKELQQQKIGQDVRCVVASVQTLQGRRLERWPRDYFDLIVTDEAHHAPASSYLKVYAHFHKAKHLGVTATPDRLDGTNLGEVFEHLAFEYDLPTAIRDGWLAPIAVDRSDVAVDLRGIRTTGGDFNLGDLEDRISEKLQPLVRATKERIGSRQTVVFTPDVGSAEGFADALDQVGVPARAVSGKSWDRERTLRGFADGEFQALVNCQLLTEGYDCPSVAAIVLARPTQSRALLSQMIGRGTRLYGGKDDCLVVDFAWQVDGKSKLAAPVDLVVPKDADEGLLAAARRLVESGVRSLTDAAGLAQGVAEERRRKAEEARARAREQAEQDRLRQEAERLSVRVRPGASGMTFERFNPVTATATQALGVRVEESFAAKRVMATEKQVQALVNRFKMPEAEARSLSVRAASRHIEVLTRRVKGGLATLPQVRAVVRMGVSQDAALRMTFREASEYIEGVKRKRTQSSFRW